MSDSKIEIFTSQDGAAQIQVVLEQDTAWLSQAQMAELFDKDVRTVNEHIGNVFAEGELGREATIRKFRIVRQEGTRQVRREIDHYNLDVTISVGYRVKSQSGVQFRQWATRVLKDHLVQGYTLNQRRLAVRGIEFEQALDLLSRTLANQGLVFAEGEAVASVISDHAFLIDFSHLEAKRFRVINQFTSPAASSCAGRTSWSSSMVCPWRSWS